MRANPSFQGIRRDEAALRIYIQTLCLFVEASGIYSLVPAVPDHQTRLIEVIDLVCDCVALR